MKGSLEDQREMQRRGLKLAGSKPETKMPDLENQPSETPRLPEVEQPHDSAYVHSALKERHTLAVLPTLNTDDNGNSKWIIIGVLIGLTFFAAWGVAYEAQLIATPHIAGQCPAPAVIEKGGCFTVQTSTGANGASVTTLVPAGHLTG